MHIGFLLFERVTQLDLTAPFEVLASVPEARTWLIAKAAAPVTSDRGLILTPTATFASAPHLDVLLIPGGPGIDDLLDDEETLAFVRRKAAGAKYVTSVCTGALLLGAAGLLRGRRATTHWNAREFLAAFGAIVVPERVVVDPPFVTGGGVTAGMDFALRLTAEIFGETRAKTVQLGLEYDPRPPFDAGSPERAGDDVLAEYRGRVAAATAGRRAAVRRAADGGMAQVLGGFGGGSRTLNAADVSVHGSVETRLIFGPNRRLSTQGCCW